MIYSEVGQESGVVSEYSGVTIYPDNLKFRMHQLEYSKIIITVQDSL